MFPSKNPLLFFLHMGGVFAILIITCLAGYFLKEPLLFAVAIFGMQALPQFPVLAGGDDEEEDEGYTGSGQAGFHGDPG